VRSMAAYSSGGTTSYPTVTRRSVHNTAGLWHTQRYATSPFTTVPVFQPMSEASSMPPVSGVAPSHCVVMGENLVLGAVKVTVAKRAWQPCDSLAEVGNSPQFCLGAVSDDVEESSWTLDSANVTHRRAVADMYRTGGAPRDAMCWEPPQLTLWFEWMCVFVVADDGWTARTTRSITLDVVLHNPHVGIFAAVEYLTTFHTTGTFSWCACHASMFVCMCACVCGCSCGTPRSSIARALHRYRNKQVERGTSIPVSEQVPAFVGVSNCCWCFGGLRTRRSGLQTEA